MWFWILNWFHSMLNSLGFQNKTARVILVGLDNAGKSTLLQKLITGETLSFPPTQKAHHEEFSIGGTTFKAWDLGGHQVVRHLWREFYAECDAVLFVVDSTDQARFHQVKEELHQLFSYSFPLNPPILLLFNKCDLKESLTNEELIECLDLFEMTSKLSKEVAFQYFRISLITGEGYREALEWLSYQI